jgi:hypothetical protein
MNIVKLQKQLQNVPDSALIGYVQNPDGQVPTYLALTEISRRKQMRDDYQQQAAPEKSVAESMVEEATGIGAIPPAQPQQMPMQMPPQMAQAPQPQAPVQMAEGGLAALDLPDDMFSEESYASGGIVAFEDGGEVPGFYKGGMPGLSEDDVAYQEALRQAELPSWMRTGLDYTALLPYTLGKKGIDYLKGRQPIYDAEQGKYVLQRDLPPVDTKAAEDAAFKARMDRGLKERADYIQANPQAAPPQVAVAQPKPNTQAAFSGPYAPNTNPEAIAERQAEILKNRFAPAAGTTDNTKPASVGSPLGIGALAYKPYQVDEAGFDALMPEQRSMRDYAAEYKAELGEDPARAAIKENLAKMRATGEKEAERAPWLALAEAGLGMAAGRSQFALQNIAEGGKQGLKAFAESRDTLRKAEERRFELESKVAQAERAEQLASINYGADSKRADDANRRVVGLAKQSDKARAAEVNARMEYDSKKDAIELKLKEREINSMDKRIDKQIAATENQGLRYELQNKRDSLKTALNELNDLIKNEQNSTNPDTAKLASLQTKFDSAYNALYSLAMQSGTGTPTGKKAPIESFNLK